MDRRSETGEGKLSGIIWLVALAAIIYAGWNVIPVYIDHYDLADKVNQACRTPRGTVKDEQIADMIMKEVKEKRLDGFIQRSCFRISTLETSRRITCSYSRTEKVLPGINHTFNLTIDVDQPLVF